MKQLKVLIVIYFFVASFSACAHRGRTNKNGCHMDSATKTAHCHNKKKVAVKKLKELKKKDTIQFPESWKDRRHTRKFEQPIEFLKNIDGPAYEKSNLKKADSKIHWISSRQVQQYFYQSQSGISVSYPDVQNSLGRIKNLQIDEYYRYFMPYEEAVKLVQHLKRR